MQEKKKRFRIRGKTVLTLELVLSVIRYEPDTGNFYWVVNRNTVKAGSKAGRIGTHGYLRVCIFGRKYLANRLAWFIFYGEWPSFELDHKNGVKDDNRIDNIRQATHSQNEGNKPLSKRNTTGAKGVSWHTCGIKYRAAIKVNHKTFHLGIFSELDEAAHAYNKAAIKHFGEFAVLNPIGSEK